MNADGNPQVELAFRRTELALERTQLAWVRTVFALTGAGFALKKGTSALYEAHLMTNGNRVGGGRVVGIALPLVGSFHLAVATWGYYRLERQLARDAGLPIPRVPLAVPLSVFVITLGLTAAALLALWG